MAADVTILDMRLGGRQRLTVASGATLPLSSTRYTLFNSVDSFGLNRLLDTPVRRISVTIYHDQAGFLDASRSLDGVTWRVYSRTSVSIPASNNITGSIHYVVEHHANWKLEWVNGGTNQTVFEPELVAYEKLLPAEPA